MEPVAFESIRDKEIQRDRIREGRHRILEKAKSDYVKRERREKQRKEQGKWMLPSVNERLMEGKSKTDKKNRNKKHKSEEKKYKKSKSKRKNDELKVDSSDSDDSSGQSEEEEEWVEKNTSTSQATIGNCSSTQEPLQRDSWMVSSYTSDYVPALTRDELRRDSHGIQSKRTLRDVEEKRRRGVLEKPGQHERELNPYWKDGGVGLPKVEASEVKKEKTATSELRAVGDGGLKWFERAYRRAIEQADEEDRTLEEVAAERWGSLEKLESMLNEARRKSRGGEIRHGERRCEFRRPDLGYDCREKYEGRDNRRVPFSKPDHRNHSRMESCDQDRKKSDHNKPSVPTSHPRWKKKEFAESTVIAVTSEKEPEKYSDKIEADPPTNIKFQHREPPETPAVLLATQLTEKEMNDLGAKIIKAELLGNNELASRLRSQLEAAKDLKSKSNMKRQGIIEEQVVIVRSKSGKESSGVSGVTKKKRVETHAADGQRARYFADDDKYSLQQMFEREKMGTAEDHNAMFARLVGKGVEKMTDDYDMDDLLTTRANRVVSAEKMDEQIKQRALEDHRRSNVAMDNCRMCFEGKDTPKHLIVAIGIKAYLTLPPFKSLSNGHCLIVPMQHVSASTYLDEDVWSEVQIFRKGLTKMFEELNKDVVFFETSLNLKRFPHMVLQCVPLPKEVGNLAPMYFKKAIMESEMEWSNNKKLVDLSQKDVRRAVPKGLPYFSVDFGLQGGFAHVVEDEQLFPRNFAQEIIGGLLDLDPIAWRKPPRENFEDQRKKVLEFADWWKPFDWTRRLKEV